MPREPRRTWRLLLGDRQVSRLLALSGFAQLHLGGLGLAALLLAEATTGSLAAAGLVAGCLSVGIGLTRPLQGWVFDRYGLRSLTVVSATHAGVAACFLAAAASRAETPLLALCALGVGFSTPAISVATRVYLTARVPESRRPAAFGIDTAIGNIAFVIGPLAVGALSAAAGPSPALALVVGVGCVGASCLGLAFSSAVGFPEERSWRPFAGLSVVMAPLLATAALGTVYGAASTTAVARALEQDRSELAGPFVAALFAGGIVGDLLLVPRHADVALERRLRSRLTGLVAAVLVIGAAPGDLTFGASLFIAGAALSSATVTVALDAVARARVDTRGEVLGWVGASLRLGNGAGTAAAGLAAEEQALGAGLLLAAVAAVVALGIVLLRDRQPQTA